MHARSATALRGRAHHESSRGDGPHQVPCFKNNTSNPTGRREQGFSSAITCTVEAGQTLYLPAGWWHEVTSQGAGGSKDAPGEHMALNHWFHPPDNLDAEAGFSKPYT